MRKLLSLLTITGVLVVQGQNIDRLYKDAQAKFFDEDLINAREIFQEVVSLNPSYKDAKYRLEICELLTNSRNRSIDTFLSYSKTNGRTDKFYHYWVGRIYVDKYEFRKAIRSWETFLNSKSYKSTEIKQEVNKFITEAKALLLMFENPDDYEIHQLPEGINTEFNEITPVFFEDNNELLFASSRDSEKSNWPTYFVYHSTQTGIRKSGFWSPPSVLRNLGKFEEEGANLELIDQDGKLFQFRPEKGGDLYYSEPIENGWSEPKEFDNSITKAHIKSHFFINEHEDRIIFTSNQHAKSSGLELYQSYRDHESGKWGKSSVLSPTINSEWDEDTPYLSLDEKSIYFSSNRPGGLGGYDIYVSRLDEVAGRWNEPVNLGFPINSPDNEIHFNMNPDQKSGYFSSDRYRSLGGHDIYFYWEIEKVNMTGRIIDLTANTPTTDVIITFRTMPYEDEYFRSETNEFGMYKTRIVANETFSVEIERNGQVLFRDEYDVHPTGGLETTYHQDFFIGEGTAPVAEVEYTGPPETEAQIEELGSKFRPGRTAVIRNIYFNHGTSQLKKSSTPVLQALLKTMKNAAKLRIEVAGHTDSIGPDDVNEWLSQRRAEAIQKWLSKRGIVASRVVPKGYGESKPMASNDDEKEGRELNRRIEIIVIE
ncbi:MAG: OmpA family protein [Cytophagales bacterium]|nr:OmpA family protein [Cytophagales bacterium]